MKTLPRSSKYTTSLQQTPGNSFTEYPADSTFTHLETKSLHQRRKFFLAPMKLPPRLLNHRGNFPLLRSHPHTHQGTPSFQRLHPTRPKTRPPADIRAARPASGCTRVNSRQRAASRFAAEPDVPGTSLRFRTRQTLTSMKPPVHSPRKSESSHPRFPLHRRIWNPYSHAQRPPNPN